MRKLFTPDQEPLIEEFGPADVGWDDLVAMGPIAVSKWKADWEEFGHEVVVERWLLPDTSDLVEEILVPRRESRTFGNAPPPAGDARRASQSAIRNNSPSRNPSGHPRAKEYTWASTTW